MLLQGKQLPTFSKNHFSYCSACIWCTYFPADTIFLALYFLSLFPWQMVVFFPICNLPIQTYHWVCPFMSNTIGDKRGAYSAYPSGATEITTRFWWGSGCAAVNFLLVYILCTVVSRFVIFSYFNHSDVSIFLTYKIFLYLLPTFHIIYQHTTQKQDLLVWKKIIPQIYSSIPFWTFAWSPHYW